MEQRFGADGKRELLNALTAEDRALLDGIVMPITWYPGSGAKARIDRVRAGIRQWDEDLVYESKTKIIPAKELEALRNESREIEVDVVFEDDEAVAADAGEQTAPADSAPEADALPGEETLEDPRANERTDVSPVADERLAPEELRAAAPDALPSDAPTAPAVDGDVAEQTLDERRPLHSDVGATDPPGEAPPPSIGHPPLWTAPPSTEPTPISLPPASQSAPDHGALVPPHPPSPPTSPPMSGRSRQSAPHFPPTGPVAPISPIGPATIPRPGPPRPSTQPKKT